MIITTLTNEGIGDVEVKRKPRILISKYFEDKKGLREIVRSQKFMTKEIDNHWPRDLFTYFNKKLLTINDFEFGAEQGNYVFGKSFLIASSNAFSQGDLFETNVINEMITGMEDRKLLSDFFGVKLYELKTGTIDRFCGMSDHIDRWCLSLPKSNYLIVEKRYYDKIKDQFDAIGKEHGVEVVYFDSGSESVKQPCNCLVLPNGLVVANEKTPNFLGLLKNLNVDFETVNADQSYNFEGSIRCRTHYIDNFDLVSNLPAIWNVRYWEDYMHEHWEEFL
jgi:hypothetical protein